MKRLTLLALSLLVCSGCLTERDKAQWNEVWKDARGDNMEMRSGGAYYSDSPSRNIDRD